jgi:sugar phosphate isomerase/epimerase
MQLSLATWSLVSLLRGDRPMDYLDVPALVRERFGITALELNNVFFAARDSGYLQKVRDSAARAGTRLINIAVDEQGDLASADPAARELGLQRYGAWIPLAAEVGVNAIRVNSGGKDVATLPDGDPARLAAEQRLLDSLRRLCDQAADHRIAILVENHGGLSAHPASLDRVIRAVRQSHGDRAAGVLVDWGNWPPQIDRYAALQTVYPLALAVHAKIKDIDESLEHPAYDLQRCIDLTREAGYDDYLGIEYEGGGDALVGLDRAVRKLRGLIG